MRRSGRSLQMGRLARHPRGGTRVGRCLWIDPGILAAEGRCLLVRFLYSILHGNVKHVLRTRHNFSSTKRENRPYLCLFNYRSDENRPLTAFFVEVLHATIQNTIRYSDLRLIFKLNFLESQTRSENIVFYVFDAIIITSCHLSLYPWFSSYLESRNLPRFVRTTNSFVNNRICVYRSRDKKTKLS